MTAPRDLSPDKMISEREAVIRERSAFYEGARMMVEPHRILDGAHVLNIAIGRYPLPEVTRPRVVTEPESATARGRQWRVKDGQVQTRDGGDRWEPTEWLCAEQDVVKIHPRGLRFTPERIRLLADLLANPTELVEDDS